MHFGVLRAEICGYRERSGGVLYRFQRLIWNKKPGVAPLPRDFID